MRLKCKIILELNRLWSPNENPNFNDFIVRRPNVKYFDENQFVREWCSGGGDNKMD